MNNEAKSKALAYANNFVAAYNRAVDDHFFAQQHKAQELKLTEQLFPLYGQVLGKTIAIAVLYSEHDFFIFFIKEESKEVSNLAIVGDKEGFTKEWTLNTPQQQKENRVRSYLKITDSQILAEVSVPASNFLSMTVERVKQNANSHGTGRGNQEGEKAQRTLPAMVERSKKQNALNSFTEQYKEMLVSKGRRQSRGQRFEVLWREVLEFYGWKPKKFRISGEENDFTAIYQGNHILGEVRWFDEEEPMSGGKMREFLGKLDPRPKTIGLFVSHSGFDAGAISVARRAVNTKTVVLFNKDDIQKVILDQTNPSGIFDERLRDVYDSVFEQYS